MDKMCEAGFTFGQEVKIQIKVPLLQHFDR
jgi:hypothetical protein